MALPSQGQREYDTRYSGNGVAFVQLLARATHGGQVVLSEPAWASVQDQLPGSSQVLPHARLTRLPAHSSGFAPFGAGGEGARACWCRW